MVFRMEDAETGAAPTGAQVAGRVSRMKYPCPDCRVKSFTGNPQRWPSQPPSIQRSSSTAVPACTVFSCEHVAEATDGVPEIALAPTRFHPVNRESAGGVATTAPR